MSDPRSLLERESRRFIQQDGAFERLVRRRDRKRRNQRITAGVVGIAVFVAAVWIVTSGGVFDRSETSVVPGGDVTGPAETGPSMTGPTVAPDSGWFDGGEPQFGLPPEEAVPSTPEEGELVAQYHGWEGTSRRLVYVYTDGRVISWGNSGDFLSALSERRLTPEGVELVRSGVVKPRMFVAPYHWSDLPEGAWADHVSKPFVPSKYAVCYELNGERNVPGTTVLGFFPARARDILRGKDHTNPNNPSVCPFSGFPGSEVTTDEARTLLNILGTMSTSEHPTPYVRLEDSDGDLIGWNIRVVLPHGAQVPCTACF